MKTLSRMAIVVALTAMLCFASCSNVNVEKSANADAKVEQLSLPDWSRDAVIYEVNLRQYTPEGTIEAFRAHLPRLQQLGVKLLWFMPVSPIGKVDRKGTLGSYYSVQDYCAVNPEFGTMDDFKLLVKEAHQHGMKVIIDWVANHTSRDHAWVAAHPDWYVTGKDGKPVGPYDWTDVAQLSYAGENMQKEMIASMKYWLTEADIDGFRCDVARLASDYVTEQQALDFWVAARKACDAVKPVFMLAEDEGFRALTDTAFDANYGWELHHLMNGIAQEKNSVKDLQKYLERDILNFQKRTFRMLFTSNHDENSWNGTEFMRMGDAAETMAALSFTLPGFPLIYTGQEVGSKRSLEFFEKDVTSCENEERFTALYKNLIALKSGHSALHNGLYGADMVWVNTSQGKKALAFVREDERSKVFCLFNLSPDVIKNVELEGDAFYGTYSVWGKNMRVTFGAKPCFILNPWEYRIYAMEKP
ncbi:MAG: alpha-amylase [Prevotellaceae bacterium]|jgi:glycosidase|nr:alpha-amylase [Prevotellaceae bacterium]